MGTLEPWWEPQRTDSPTFTTGHPRICGERSQHPANGEPDAGSSPHARGTHRGGDDPIRPVRFIPTCAGNALVPGQFAGRVSGHPRMHGERIANGRNKLDKFGSSSHTRGTRLLAHQRRKVGRFIPAYAGNAWARPSPWTPSTVHPRLRGGRTPFLPYSSPSSGSSPHARGTQRVCRGHHVPGRFIPACAGNASMDRTNWPVSPVHPRMCGERTYGVSLMAARNGSSPHVRGTLSRLPEETDEGRFIPACAGNARRACGRAWPQAVHPRMCGERIVAAADDPVAPGSSPHVRGTLLRA